MKLAHYFAIILLLCAALPCEAATLRVVEGVTSSGQATELWLSMLRSLRAETPSQSTRRMTAAEREWTRLIESRAAHWESGIAALNSNFAPIAAPAEVLIVVGNRDGEDAFTHDEKTIGFDVSRLAALFGDATLAENASRIDRFFRHEYVHLLQKAWLNAHPYEAATPLRAALLGIWKEGLGNYYSLSNRWLASSDSARQARSELEPRFIARIAALACAPASSAGKLTADLSMGAFDRKWGALPVALWLEEESRTSEDALRRFVTLGPDGIWLIAERHLAADAAAVLREARATAALCSP